MTKSSQSILHLLHTVKSTVKISSIFVVFLENTNFKEIRSAYVLRFYKAFLRVFFVGLEKLMSVLNLRKFLGPAQLDFCFQFVTLIFFRFMV